MVELFGRALDRGALERRLGDLSQIAGWELVTLADGPGRSVRLLQARTGGGLSFRIAVDRGFDLLAMEYRGVPVGWQSPTGVQDPALHHPELEHGLGLLRSFTGLLATCGLDHAGVGTETGSAHFVYPHRKSVVHPLHGRISQLPARLAGYGVDWRDDGAVLWCEGEVRQAAMFGEVLELRRRIEAPLGGAGLAIHDVVTNRGFRPTPHMLLYHLNFGWPLLDEGAEFLAPVAAVQWATHPVRGQGVGYRRQAAPRDDFVEQVYEHRMEADAAGLVPAALVNPAVGLGALVEYRLDQLPCLFEWQCLQSGIYALGIEPCTNHILGREEAERRGELAWLGHGEQRTYDIALSVVDGPAAIDALRRRIAAVRPPAEEFEEPTGF